MATAPLSDSCSRMVRTFRYRGVEAASRLGAHNHVRVGGRGFGSCGREAGCLLDRKPRRACLVSECEETGSSRGDDGAREKKKNS